MKFRCVWSIVLILGLAAAGTQAEAAGDRAVIAHSAYDLEEKEIRNSALVHSSRKTGRESRRLRFSLMTVSAV